jgi:hypothetical protein
MSPSLILSEFRIKIKHTYQKSQHLGQFFLIKQEFIHMNGHTAKGKHMMLIVENEAVKKSTTRT